MRKIIYFLIIVIFVAGCFVRQKKAAQMPEELAVGMGRQEVINLVGKDNIRSYESLSGGEFETVQEEDNPFDKNRDFSGALKDTSASMEAIYFSRLNNETEEEETVPFVFKEGKLIGWGDDFLNSIKSSYKR